VPHSFRNNHFSDVCICIISVITAFLSILDVCEPSWQQSRVGLITSQFAFSILVIVLGIILPLIMIIARKLYRQFHKEVRNFPPAPSTSDGNVQRNPQTDSGMYGQFESPLVLMRTLTSLVL